MPPRSSDEIDIELRDEDIEEQVFRASGPGGQHVNKTSSAIRLTHLPTGIVVQCQTERSQHKNRATAMKMLRARLARIEEEKREAEQAAKYNQMPKVGFGSQIRNYFLHPEQRVKDARTGYRWAVSTACWTATSRVSSTPTCGGGWDRHRPAGDWSIFRPAGAALPIDDGRKHGPVPFPASSAKDASMLPEQVEELRRRYTDQYVVADARRPELARFAGLVGQVKTVNMSGRALVQFPGVVTAWFDIDPEFLQVVQKPG